MRAWIFARRFRLWLLALLALGVLADLFGSSALPVTAGDGAAVPVVAVVPSLSAAIVISALEAPMRSIHPSFPRTTRALDSAWLFVGSAAAFLLMLPVVSSVKSAFTPGDLLRNVAIFTAAAALTGVVTGVRQCWILPALIVVTSFIPASSTGRHWWAPAVWSGGEIASQWPACLVALACCAALIGLGPASVLARIPRVAATRYLPLSAQRRRTSSAANSH
jgi:hypothetical protein